VSAPEDLARVRIRRLPLLLHQRAQEHSDELNREFRLMAEQSSDADVPRRLVELGEALTARYSLVEYRRWYLNEFVVQLSGGEPTVFPDPEAARS